MSLHLDYQGSIGRHLAGQLCHGLCIYVAFFFFFFFWYYDFVERKRAFDTSDLKRLLFSSSFISRDKFFYILISH
ncbi:hypothetical protein M406DRAFT_358081 [Cryphonectria parasitica EP155]|uniref:Uncharacterized protein n=1 Tax=Cryphonectria parasitica (strain ATCC 38755 / EP155) TaxID=660469 RepID=A0A9P4XVG5_CRYP1|nr:uncharacterized protein M406DRAFT_358081 [Cryphonectria parasitica EP155]KAF3761714.1 hypothetical protein M406DRAFT_358081 [Cryphonectria parasitica EP155]